MENDDDVLEFFVKMHIIHCLPFTFPGISVRSLISQRHLVSCGTITYFVSKKICCADRSWKFIFLVIEKSWKIIVEKQWSP